MDLFMSLYLAALFVAFVPGVLVTLPPRSSRNVVLAVHAALFVLVWHFTHKMVFRMLYEGFQNNMNNSANTNVNANANASANANANNSKMNNNSL
jgi:hypothetical protein